MSNQSNSSGGGVSFFGLLTILFIGLKLTHVIPWSWWLVLAPLWAGVAFQIVIFTIILVVGLTATGAAAAIDRYSKSVR